MHIVVKVVSITTKSEEMEVLLSMGFSEEESRRAFESCGRNIELALESLLNPSPVVPTIEEV